MSTKNPLKTVLSCLVLGLFFWFFASSISIAYHKAPQHDDVMFATIPKNFLNGYGWATSYGEKIPFNPDISTGPTLLLPAAAMLAVFSNQSWVPAMTGAIMNIVLASLILWQLRQQPRFVASALALLLSLSLFAVNDFKTFTGYYTTALLFLSALLFVLNQRYPATLRFFLYGVASAVGLYGKPLILLSFLLALPVLIVFAQRENAWKNLKLLLIVFIGFLAIFLPWQLYRHQVLSHYPVAYQIALNDYGRQFFDNHGSGFGQLKDKADKLTYLKLNAAKNFRLLSHSLSIENNYPFYFLSLVLFSSFWIFFRALRKRVATNSIQTNNENNLTLETLFPFVLAIVIVGNLLWYIAFSFAMTPGHTFFLTFFAFLLLFFMIAQQSHSEWLGICLCVLTLFLFQVRLPALAEAYSFKVVDIIDNAEIEKTLHYLQTHPARYPLASCGYTAAPYRLEYLLPGSQNFVDCYNVLEDSLVLDTVGNVHWQAEPNFTFVFEGLSLLAAARSQEYVLGPIWQSCQQHLLFHEGIYYVCDVPFAELRDKLDPTETQKQLIKYQHWYRTRIKS